MPATEMQQINETAAAAQTKDKKEDENEEEEENKEEEEENSVEMNALEYAEFMKRDRSRADSEETLKLDSLRDRWLRVVSSQDLDEIDLFSRKFKPAHLLRESVLSLSLSLFLKLNVHFYLNNILIAI